MDLLADEGSDKAWRTVAAIARTCRYLRVEGVRRLLSRTVRVNFHLMNQSHLVSPFCRFVLGDPIARLSYLRRLSVDVRHLEEGSARLFARVLSGSSHLHHLEITSLFEVTTPVLHILCSAFSALTSLQHFSVGYCKGEDPNHYPVLYHALQTMRSPLTSVHIIVPLIKFPNPFILYTRDQDPIFLLSKLTGSLRRISVYGVFAIGGGIHIYHLVEELQIQTYLAGIPHLATYLLCFPNLKHLRCGSRRTAWTRYRHAADTLKEKCYLATIQDWNDLNKRETTRKTHAWTMLESFRGSIIDAYVLALPCRVERLHLLSTGGKRSAEYTMLSSILSDTRPSSLRLCLKIYEGRGYIPILPPQSSDSWAQDLTTLEIRINIVKQVFDLQKCIDHVVEMLRTITVTSFRLELRCANTKWQSHESHQDRQEAIPRGMKCVERYEHDEHDVCYIMRILEQHDFHQHVRDIMNANPTLRRVVVMWRRCGHMTKVPNQVVGIDLDEIPHSIDRAGVEADGWDNVGEDW
ncbi:hypothetical protein L226DRAFT_576681 [Lentinus tigrinus ALCF2SS1-7]|uniref:F-box domain-containing protein n=1 Tax=Lentinus tigrinus ALCF2SS1-6 TaxID=1328759 RepID=A0A5C2RNJ1_9APHY|nr:hypothetical protein L227DRAFT_617450 [Lentinus tigrinus ALCF2SS1-6]RPD68112.1 hypothetical protein L226DRAFT_576681 [Lentinus tigrinus ALCF2SS1-7]